MPEFHGSSGWSEVRIWEDGKPVQINVRPARPQSDFLQMLDSGELDTIGQKRLGELGLKIRSHHIGPKADYKFVPIALTLTKDDERHHYFYPKDLPKDSHLYIRYDGSRFRVWLKLEQFGKHYTLCETEAKMP